MFYEKIIRPILFKIDPEKVHDKVTFWGTQFGKFYVTKKLTKSLFHYENSKLTQTIKGITFKNPVGLAAGFDKDANLVDILPSVGFGFEEIGSVTAKPCKGNPGKRLWRLPKYKSLVVYYGLKSLGCQTIAKKLQNKKLEFPIGISIAKTNCQETADSTKGIADYVESFRTLQHLSDYVTINISCPNAFGGQPFHKSELLNQLLEKINEIPTSNEVLNSTRSKPIFLKLSPDLTTEEMDEIIKVCDKYNIYGFVISNLTKNREKTGIPPEEFANIGENGGISGKFTQKYSNNLISHVYQKTQGKYIIIGVGGIYDAEDAYEKIKHGASLVQLITGMIYGGPAIIGKINKGLVKLLEKDGFDNIEEAIGIYHSNL